MARVLLGVTGGIAAYKAAELCRLLVRDGHDVVPGAVTIFISARVEELERRLRERATESAGEIGERIELARKQLEHAGEFDHVIENDDLERAVAELTTLVRRLLGATATMPQR